MTFVHVHNKAKIRSIAEIHFLLHDLRFLIVMTEGIIILKKCVTDCTYNVYNKIACDVNAVVLSCDLNAAKRH